MINGWAVLAWLEGNGPDPWEESEKMSKCGRCGGKLAWLPKKGRLWRVLRGIDTPVGDVTLPTCVDCGESFIGKQEIAILKEAAWCKVIYEINGYVRDIAQYHQVNEETVCRLVGRLAGVSYDEFCEYRCAVTNPTATVYRLLRLYWEFPDEFIALMNATSTHEPMKNGAPIGEEVKDEPK